MDRKGKEERRAEKSVERGPGGMGLGNKLTRLFSYPIINV